MCIFLPLVPGVLALGRFVRGAWWRGWGHRGVSGVVGGALYPLLILALASQGSGQPQGSTDLQVRQVDTEQAAAEQRGREQ